MKTSQILGAIVLSVLGVASASAETYQGVQTVNSVRSRAEVAAEGAQIARAGNVYGDVAQAGVTPARTSALARADLRNEAVATARAGNIYGDGAQQGVLALAGQRDRAEVRAEARAAARSPQLF